MWNAEVLALVMTSFFVAGLVKGVVGFGLPLVVLAILATTLGMKEAIALIVVPAIIMNIYQAMVGGNFRVILRRIWTMLVVASAFTWVGVSILAVANPVLVAGLLGLLLMTYSIYSLTGSQLSPPRTMEPWLTPIVGALSGISYAPTRTSQGRS